MTSGDQPQGALDRPFPQSSEAEQATLGAMLLDGQAVVEVASLLSEEDFTNRAHQLIYRAIFTLNDRGQAVDLTTVTEQLRASNHLEQVGGAEYLMTLTDRVSRTSNVMYYAHIVADRGIARKLIKASQQISELGFKGEIEVEDMLNKAEEIIFSIADGKLSGDFTPVRDLVTQTFDRIDQRSKAPGQVMGLETGFIDLDLMTGGFQSSDLIIVAGRPSMGKTSLAMNIAQFVTMEREKPVGIFSLEMSSDQLVEQLLCAHARVNAHHLRMGTLSPQDWRRLMKSIDALYKAPLFIDDTPGLSAAEMRAKARRLKAREDVSLIVIDYVQLISPPQTRSESRATEIAYIARQLKQMARELSCPVIAISQLSRAVERRENKRPMLSDLMESSALEAEADLVCFVYRPKYYEQRDESEAEESRKRDEDMASLSAEDRRKVRMEEQTQADVAELIVAKHRTGPTGTVNLTFIPKYRSFRSYSKETDAPPPPSED